MNASKMTFPGSELSDFHFVKPCENPSDLCKKFCGNMKLMEKHVHDEEMMRLMGYVSHPAQWNHGGTWTVPFCYQD